MAESSRTSTFSMENVVAQGVLDEPRRGTLYVDWKLARACNYRCSYCFAQQKPGSETYSRSRMLAAASAVLRLNRPEYVFNIAGGEPTLNPHLPELVTHLYTQSDNANIIIITNGSQSPEYFTRLAGNARPGSMNIHISLHVEFASFSHLQRIIRELAFSRQGITIRFMNHPDKREGNRRFCEDLLRLREEAPFGLTMRSLRMPPHFIQMDDRYTEEDFQWMADAEREFQSVAAMGPEAVQTPWDRNAASYHLQDKPGGIRRVASPHYEAMRNGQTNFKGFYCCTGTNLLSINADLTWSGAVCGLAAKGHGTVDTVDLAPESLMAVVPCSFDNCGCDANFVLPKFASIENAKQYIEKYNEIYPCTT